MSSRDRFSDAKVDAILEELQQDGLGPSASGYDESQLDAIMAELGMTNETREQKNAKLVNSLREKRRSPSSGQKKDAPLKSDPPSSQPNRATKPKPQEGKAAAPHPKNNPRPAPRTRVSEIPRSGKASAMEKVELGKYENDPDFAKWFGENGSEKSGEKQKRKAASPARKGTAAKPSQSSAARVGEEEPEKTAQKSSRPPRREQPQEPEKRTPNPKAAPQPRTRKAEASAGRPLAKRPPKKTAPAATQRMSAGEDEPNEAAFRTWDGPALSGNSEKDEAEWRARLEKDNEKTLQLYDIDSDEADNDGDEDINADTQGEASGDDGDTKVYKTVRQGAHGRVPTAAFTQRFDPRTDASPSSLTDKQLQGKYLDDRVDDGFRAFFEETVAQTDPNAKQKPKSVTASGAYLRRKKRRSTGEFAILEHKVDQIEQSFEENEDEDEFNHLHDAIPIQEEIAALKQSLLVRTAVSGVLAGILIWLSLGFSGNTILPDALGGSAPTPMAGLIYVVVIVLGIVLHYKTLLSGIGGLFGAATIETPPAVALIAALFQAVVLLLQMLSHQTITGTLFGGLVMLLLMVHSLGKAIQTGVILKNFKFASSGRSYSAAYALQGYEDLAEGVTSGMEEQNPVLMVSRETTLMKKFMRQSFSQRLSDRLAKVMGWVLLVVAGAVGTLTWLQTRNLYTTAAAVAGTLAFGAPLSSSFAAAVPAALLQKNASKAGAVVPGWSAMEDLANVNVVMAETGDLLPTETVLLQRVNVYEKDSVDMAIFYAASILVEGSDTLCETFLDMVENKREQLYKVESLSFEPGRGFTAWANENRVVMGTREMMQRNAVEPPSVQDEIKQLPPDCVPLYLAVSGRLIAMFAVEYRPDVEVSEVLHSMKRSGISLLVTSHDVAVTAKMIEKLYNLPRGMVKVLSQAELERLSPLTQYIPESDGVLAHLGGFGSLIAGIRAASGCAMAEKMAGILQIASMLVAAVLCFLLVLGGGLATISLLPVFLYQLAWGVLVAGVPLTRNYG